VTAPNRSERGKPVAWHSLRPNSRVLDRTGPSHGDLNRFGGSSKPDVTEIPQESQEVGVVVPTASYESDSARATPPRFPSAGLSDSASRGFRNGQRSRHSASTASGQAGINPRHTKWTSSAGDPVPDPLGMVRERDSSSGAVSDIVHTPRLLESPSEDRTVALPSGQSSPAFERQNGIDEAHMIRSFDYDAPSSTRATGTIADDESNDDDDDEDDVDDDNEDDAENGENLDYVHSGLAGDGNGGFSERVDANDRNRPGRDIASRSSPGVVSTDISSTRSLPGTDYNSRRTSSAWTGVPGRSDGELAIGSIAERSAAIRDIDSIDRQSGLSDVEPPFGLRLGHGADSSSLPHSPLRTRTASHEDNQSGNQFNDDKCHDSSRDLAKPSPPDKASISATSRDESILGRDLS